MKPPKRAHTFSDAISYLNYPAGIEKSAHSAAGIRHDPAPKEDDDDGDIILTMLKRYTTFQGDELPSSMEYGSGQQKLANHTPASTNHLTVPSLESRHGGSSSSRETTMNPLLPTENERSLTPIRESNTTTADNVVEDQAPARGRSPPGPGYLARTATAKTHSDTSPEPISRRAWGCDF
ncbi:hypothetical protein AJ80_09242 [Polytolypa hystricis UAMH7299]|uniref:Uncharacterized protein n=1 Tax=Polytolypa hystricis (strain UAMH7299) TaxID=1447883 RepID=A0A2B7WTK0_POLH7|nr:hypothetical protein AJ80_09242 [Polytolypa hystricis UAMH7299]